MCVQQVDNGRCLVVVVSSNSRRCDGERVEVRDGAMTMTPRGVAQMECSSRKGKRGARVRGERKCKCKIHKRCDVQRRIGDRHGNGIPWKASRKNGGDEKERVEKRAWGKEGVVKKWPKIVTQKCKTGLGAIGDDAEDDGWKSVTINCEQMNQDKTNDRNGKPIRGRRLFRRACVVGDAVLVLQLRMTKEFERGKKKKGERKRGRRVT